LIALFLAALLAVVPADAPTPPPTAPPDVPPLRDLITPAQVLARYAGALAAVPAPHVISFEYVVEQIGARDLLQTHRVFRSGTNQRDEIIAVDGHTLDPPAVRITTGRRDRYAISALAPRLGAYDFHFVGASHVARHKDYTFVTRAHQPGAFRVTAVTIDGSTFLPNAIAFETAAHGGTGRITYVRVDRYWVPLQATAHATYAKLAASEKISFASYRFPAALPPETFSQPHRAPVVKPDG
jgi:hypothetical protein